MTINLHVSDVVMNKAFLFLLCGLLPSYAVAFNPSPFIDNLVSCKGKGYTQCIDNSGSEAEVSIRKVDLNKDDIDEIIIEIHGSSVEFGMSGGYVQVLKRVSRYHYRIINSLAAYGCNVLDKKQTVILILTFQDQALMFPMNGTGMERLMQLDSKV